MLLITVISFESELSSEHGSPQFPFYLLSRNCVQLLLEKKYWNGSPLLSLLERIHSKLDASQGEMTQFTMLLRPKKLQIEAFSQKINLKVTRTQFTDSSLRAKTVILPLLNIILGKIFAIKGIKIRTKSNFHCYLREKKTSLLSNVTLLIT